MDVPTWANLVAAEPDLKAFERDADQAGRNNVVSWLGWLKSFGLFTGLLRKIEQHHPGARGVVWDHLEVTFARAAAERTRGQTAASARGAMG